jgi:hypothetical protein
MKSAIGHLRRGLTALVALTLVVGLYGLTRLPAFPPSEMAEATARFHFTRSPLPEVPGYPHKMVRAVHPSLNRIAAWISSLGAAVALGDLDGDGLPNDLCYVDPRTDLVVVAPVPGTPARYQPFVLDAAPLPYDPATMAPMGCVIGDFNEDGLLDILVYYWGRTPIVFLRKKGNGSPLTQPSPPGGEGRVRGTPLSRAEYVPCELVPGGEPQVTRWYTNAVTQADLDGDGHVDLIIANYFQDGARILDAQAGGVEEMHAGKAKSFNGGRKHLLRWVGATRGQQPTVQFEEVPGVLDEAVERGWTLAVGAADLDGDLLPEIYFANDFGPDRLLHNRSTPGHFRFVLLEGRRELTSPTSCILGQDSFKGMGCDFGDVNGDGLLDIYVSNIATEFGLQESHFLWQSTGEVQRMQEGIAPYVQASEALGLSRGGWGWDCRLADFDNDGVLEAIQAVGFLKGTVNRWPELQALGTANSQILHNPGFWPRFRPGDDLSGHERIPFFVRGKDGRYHNIAPALGWDDPMVSRGIALADVDGDGRLDFALANQWETSYFYRNDSPNVGAFLGLHLLLPLEPGKVATLQSRPGHPGADTPGRPAIGAAATVHLPDGRRLVAQVDGGTGHSGKRSPDLHFGLGYRNTNELIPVDLRWRSPDGQIHQQTLHLPTGWHTVQLAWPSSVERKNP